MKNVFTLILALTIALGLKAQCPLPQAVDFTATDIHGTEIHLFDILDAGQYVLIDFFFTTCGSCQETTPMIVESYHTFGCNQHDVYYIEVDKGDSDQACINWVNNYGVEYPTISGSGGGNAICNQYDISSFPTVILIAPDRQIVIQDLYPIPSAQTVVNALTPYGIELHDCTEPVEEAQVAVTINETTPTSITATFTPNEQCSAYSYLLNTESEMEMWQSMMGVSLAQLIQQWGITIAEEDTHQWDALTPNTTYTIYVLPKDADNNLLEPTLTQVNTLAQGGTGNATVNINIEVISETSVRTTATPNEEVAEFRYGLITKDYYNEIGMDSAVAYFQEDYYVFYTEDQHVWTDLEPNTYYYAIGVAKNALNEWGTPTIVEFITSLTSVAENDTQLRLSPNPANDVVTLKGENLGTVRVFNTLGQMMDEFKTQSTELRIGTTSYENGIYVIKAGDKVMRFVVKH